MDNSKKILGDKLGLWCVFKRNTENLIVLEIEEFFISTFSPKLVIVNKILTNVNKIFLENINWRVSIVEWGVLLILVEESLSLHYKNEVLGFYSFLRILLLKIRLLLFLAFLSDLFKAPISPNVYSGNDIRFRETRNGVGLISCFLFCVPRFTREKENISTQSGKKFETFSTLFAFLSEK